MCLKIMWGSQKSIQKWVWKWESAEPRAGTLWDFGANRRTFCLSVSLMASCPPPCVSQDCDCLASQAQLVSILLKKEGPDFLARDGEPPKKLLLIGALIGKQICTRIKPLYLDLLPKNKPNTVLSFTWNYYHSYASTEGYINAYHFTKKMNRPILKMRGTTVCTSPQIEWNGPD